MAHESLSASDILQVVSRSFAVCIPLLEHNKRVEVENQYLLARFIDTIEDSHHTITDKTLLVQDFLDIITGARKNCTSLIDSVREKTIDDHDLTLINNFEPIVNTFRTFDSAVQQCALECLAEMGRGMMLYQQKQINSFEDLDEYCYFVAGTVGKYLTTLVKIKDGIELDMQKSLANGRYLQKINIIKDFHKDFSEGRMFWPTELFNGITPKDAAAGNGISSDAMRILTCIIANARGEEPATFEYLMSIPESIPGYRAFCIVPALMAHETLNLMQDNAKVFQGNNGVKIPRSRVIQILLNVKMGYYTNKRLSKMIQV